MLAQVKGVVRGNTVYVEDNDISDYDGTEVVVTLLNYAKKKAEQTFDILQFVKPDERAARADEYVKELRDNDRL